MMDRMPRRLAGSCPADGIVLRRIRLVVAFLLTLGVLAWLALTSLHAQPGPGQPEPKKDAPKKELPDKTADQPPPPGEQPPPAHPAVQLPGMKRLMKKIGKPTPRPPAAPAAPMSSMPGMGGQVHFQFKIDPETPSKDLLPAAPKIKKSTAPVLSDDLTRVPEVQFQAPDDAANAEAMKHIAHQIAKINHLNDKKTDGFIEALRDERLDLHGLPFAMGDACRTKGERSRQFALAVATVRRAMQDPGVPQSSPGPASGMPPGGAGMSGGAPTSVPAGMSSTPTFVNSAFVASVPVAPEKFWEQYQTLCTQEDRAQKQATREQCATITQARIAALRQILAPMPAMQPGLVKYLSTISHVEATQALARMAIFSADEDVRKAALDALKIRRERDYTDILVKGLRYPWPAVARRAAEAITKLERNDLLPQLIDLLEEPDPRAPMTEEVNHKRVPVVRELVRVNHHRNCLLCHAPGNTGKVSAEAVTAEVPVPGQPMTPPSGGYNTSQPDILVRVDVTYLRQDFSALQPVADANPWPEMQRFDFLVRRRTLTDEEATAFREKLTPREPGQFSPYRRAALVALRDLTGRDTEPTPEAWRRLLKLSAEPQGKTKTP
jgi:hypothetical protein